VSVSWERLAGDTAAFAVKMALHADPDEGRGATPEESASWGEIRFIVRERNLCAHTVGGGAFEACRWHLLPVLEWFAENWDPLFHEEKLPVRPSKSQAAESLDAARFSPEGLSKRDLVVRENRWSEWWSRHCLQASRAGGVFPDLCIRRRRDEIELSWRESALAGLPEDFRFSVPVGVDRFPPRAVAEPLHEVCLAASSELRGRIPGSARLKRLVKRFEERKASREAREGRLAWMIGLGATATSMRRRLADLRKRLRGRPKRAMQSFFGGPEEGVVLEGSCQAALMFGSLAPDVRMDDVILLADAALSSFVGGASPEPGLDGSVLLDGIPGRLPAWKEGQELALEALRHFGVSWKRGFVDVEGLAGDLGIATEPIHLSDASVRGASIAGPGHEPTILVNENFPENERPEVRRYTIAHEFCHLLADRKRGVGFAIASGPWAPEDVERRANAFAAMFLMPPDLVRESIDRTDADPKRSEGVTALARRMRTSFTATLAHLCNTGFIDESTRDRMRFHRLEKADEGEEGHRGISENE